MYISDITDTLIEPTPIDGVNFFPYVAARVDYGKYRKLLHDLYRYCIRSVENDEKPNLRWTEFNRLTHIRTSNLPEEIQHEISELKRMVVSGKLVAVRLILKLVFEFSNLITEGPLTPSTEHLLYKLKQLQYAWRYYLIARVKTDPNTTEITNISGVYYWLVRNEHNKLVLGKPLTMVDVNMWQVYQLKFEVLSYLILNFHSMSPDDQFVLLPITAVNTSFCQR